LIEPVVVVPEWVDSLTPSEQRMILRHECAHISARDPWLVGLANIIPVLLPWNAPIWLQSRRLREAVELDCDGRVLQGNTNAHSYAELLLSVGGRSAGLPVAVAALSEPRSLLEKRIRRMFEKRPRHRALQATGWTVVAAVAVLCAFRAPLPGERLPQPLAPAEPAVQSVVPVLTSDTTPPRLLNPVDVHEAARRYYPASARAAEIEGKPRVSVHVTETGEVAVARLSESSGNDALDQAALKVAGVMQFAPAEFNGRAIPVWFDVTIDFTRDRLSRPRPDEQQARAAAVAERREPTRAVQVAAAAKPGFAAPAPRNVGQFREAVARAYPQALRESGVGGQVGVAVYVDESGKVSRMQIKSSSGVPELDEAALRVAGMLQFTPARSGDRTTGAWLDLPINFQAPVPERMPEPAAARRAAVAASPVFTPYTVAPKLLNQQDVGATLQRYYPPLLRDAGIGGTANVWFFIDEDGKVLKAELKQSTGHDALDEAALRVAQTMVFSPALNRDQKVNVWVDMPIVFRAKEQPQASATRRGAGNGEVVATTARYAPAQAAEQVSAGAIARRPAVAPAQTTVEPGTAKTTTSQAGPTSVTATARPARAPGSAGVVTRAAPAAAVAGAAPSSAGRIVNPDAVGRALQRFYPPLLRDAGIGGEVMLAVVVDTDGTVLKSEVRQSSGHRPLDEAALKVAAIVQFAPTGVNGPIEVDVPIVFKAQ
jgi:TonB family protein